MKKIKINLTKENKNIIIEEYFGRTDKEKGYIGWIEVVESQKINGIFVNAAGVAYIQLDDRHYAYRTESENQDGDWNIGSEEDVVDAAIEFYDMFEEIKGHE